MKKIKKNPGWDLESQTWWQLYSAVVKEVGTDPSSFDIMNFLQKNDCSYSEESLPKQPNIQQPSVSQSIASQPIASQPIVSQPIASRPIVSRPIVSQPPSVIMENKSVLSSSGTGGYGIHLI